MNESNESIIDFESEGPLQDDVNKPGNSKESKGGGITCSVPECYNNSKRDKTLSWYKLPSDKNLRKQWLAKISRKDFKPNSHRICSAHFVGGKKTYDNNIPTIVPKTIKPTVTLQRTTRNSIDLNHKTHSYITTNNKK